VAFLADRIELMGLMPPEGVDAIFADLPYRPSKGA
jgi:hypothetical protein